MSGDTTAPRGLRRPVGRRGGGATETPAAAPGGALAPSTPSATPAAPAPRGEQVVPQSSFDFLEGRFRAAARVRTMNVLTTAVAVVAVATVLVFGITTELQAQFTQRDVDDVAQQQSEVQAELARSQSSARGATAAEVDQHVKRRATQAANILQNQPDYIGVIEKITALPGVTVENVQLEADTKTAGTVAAVSVTGTAADVTSATTATEALSDPGRFSFLKKGDQSSTVQCSGAARSKDSKFDPCTWGWQGTLRSDVMGVRAKAVEDTFKVKPSAKPAPAPVASGG